jgi:hypothetical protein
MLALTKTDVSRHRIQQKQDADSMNGPLLATDNQVPTSIILRCRVNTDQITFSNVAIFKRRVAQRRQSSPNLPKKFQLMPIFI